MCIIKSETPPPMTRNDETIAATIEIYREKKNA